MDALHFFSKSLSSVHWTEIYLMTTAEPSIVPLIHSATKLVWRSCFNLPSMRAARRSESDRENARF